MIVIVFVVGTLTSQILFCVCEASVPCFILPVEVIELAVCDLHSVPVPVHCDLAVLSEGKLCLTESERLGEGNQLTLALIDRDPHSFKAVDDLIGQPAQGLHVRKNDVVIIHVVGRTMHPCLTLHEIIYGAWEGYHLLLRGFYPQRHTAPRGRARGRCHHQIGQPPDSGIKDQVLVAAVYSGVWRIWEKSLQVQEEHPSPSPVPLVVPPQMFFQAAVCEMKAFPPLTCPVVIDHAGAVERNQNIVAKGLVNLPVCDVGRVDAVT